MYVEKISSELAGESSPRLGNRELGNERHARERRLELLIRQLPNRLQTATRWLRQPSRRWLRLPAGFLLVLGSVFSILPILGLWMLPLGLVLLAEDVPLLRRWMNRVLAWIETKRPHWMGLSRHGLPQ